MLHGYGMALALRAPAPGWLFPMGAGFFGQARVYVMHSFAAGCHWRARHRIGAPRCVQSRLGALVLGPYRAE